MKLLIKSVVVSLLVSLPLFSQQSYHHSDLIFNENPALEGLDFHLSDAGNNSELSDIGGAFFRKKYIILSNKKRGFAKISRNSYNNKLNKAVFCADIYENDNLSYPLVFSKILNSQNDQGGLAFTPNERTIYFTRSKKENHELYSIYKANLNLKSKYYWTNIQELIINSKEFSIETPCVSKDGKKIYFSSNMKGGYGGFDIYVAKLTPDGNIVEAVNLGPQINSEKDDKYPFISEDGKYFYLSTNGRKGFGGYDVFRASIVGDGYLNIINLGNKLNTSNDDIAFVLHTPYTGYVSSNERQNPENFNVYKFHLNENTQKNHVALVDAKTQKPMNNIPVLVKDEFGNVVANATTDAKGEFNLKLDLLNKYTVTAVQEGYLPVDDSFIITNSNNGSNKHFKTIAARKYPFIATVKEARSKELVANTKVLVKNDAKEVVQTAFTNNKGVVYLDVQPNITYTVEVEKEGFEHTKVLVDKSVNVINGSYQTEILLNKSITINPIENKVEIENIFFDFDKATIKAESQVTLDDLAKFLTKNPNIQILISAHTDTNGTDVYNNTLSQKRGKAVYDYLTIVGISQNRLNFKGFGKTAPKVACGENCNEDQDQENRRVEFIIK